MKRPACEPVCGPGGDGSPQPLDTAARPRHDADAEVNRIVGILNAHHALLVDQAIGLLADEAAWVGDGMTTLASWLRWRCGLAPASADAIVAIAERAPDLPESLAAFRRGQLSLDQMASIARRAPSWTDAQACEYAIAMTVPQLRRVLANYPFPHLGPDGLEVRPDDVLPTDDIVEDADDHVTVADRCDAVESQPVGPSDSAAVLPRFTETCSMFQLDDGTYRLSAHLDVDTGMVVERSLDEARDRLFHDGHTNVTLADALVKMAEQSVDAVADTARRNRFKVVMFLDPTSPATTTAPGMGMAMNMDMGMGDSPTTGAGDAVVRDVRGRRMPDSVRRHLTCTGNITPVLLDGGLPVSVGRTQHIVPARTRTLIEHRDRGCCRVPGCPATLGLEVHHIVHWEHGGPTDTWNLVLVCGRHHRMHHRGRLDINGNADQPNGLEFRNEHGRVITPSGADPDPPLDPPAAPTCTYQHPDGGRLDTSRIWFQPPAAHITELRERAPNDAAYLAALEPPGC